MKRYRVYAYFDVRANISYIEHSKHPDGEWVKWEDVEKLFAELAELHDELGMWRNVYGLIKPNRMEGDK
jgi:hypothetical protein